MRQNNQSPRRRIRLLAIGLSLLLAVLALASCGNDEGAGEDVSVGGIHPADIVAKYDGGEVTGKQLIAYLGARKYFYFDEMYAFYEMLPNYKESMLYELIANRIITKDAGEDILKASKETAESMMDSLQGVLKENEDFKTTLDSFLSAEGITMQDLQDFIVLSYNLQAVLENKYTDEEIRAKYDEIRNQDENAFLRATVRHILVSLTDAEGNERTQEDALKRAQEAQVKLKNGGDWTTIAKEYSDDPGSSGNGGKYEDYPVSAWVEEFKQHAIEQPVGEVGEPFLTAYGYHVMVVEERRQPEFDEVKDQVRNQMIDEYYTNMVEVEVPKLVTEINLPVAEEETADGTGEGDTGAAE